MALSDKNIIITPNIGSASDPKIQFSGADASTGAQTITLNVYPTSGGMLSFEGSSGQLFSIANSLTGTIYSVNDVSGMPSIEVIDSGLVKLAQYSGNVLIGTATNNGSKLNVSGTAYIDSGTTDQSLTLSVSDSSWNYIGFNHGSTRKAYFGINGSGNPEWGTDSGAFTITGNYTTIASSTRSPIYYDSQDTNYYVDPASTSYLYSGQISGQWQFIANRNTTSDSPPLQAFSNNGSGAIMAFHRSGQYAVNFGLDSDNVMRIGGWSADANRWQLDMSGNQTVAGSSRAPIFYDLNDTGYYVDPNTTGTSINAAGSIRGGYYVASNYASTGYTQYKGYDNNNHFIVIRGAVSGNTSALTLTGGHQTTFVEYAEANDGTGWFFKTAATGNYDIVSRITRSYSYFEGNVRSPIFYDSDDTGYYIDAQSTGAAALRMRGGALFGPNPTWGAYLYVGGNGDYDSGQAQIFTTNGNLHLEPGSGHAIYLDNYRGGWFRANGWYDNNDTGYYINPNDMSRMARVDPDEIYNHGWFRNHYNNKGLYNQANGTHFYSNSAAAWAITGSGGTVELQFRSNHDSTMRGYVYANTGGSIGFLDYNGNWRIRGDGANVELYGGTYVDSLYAYQWYDRNDTGYYVDPNSNSNMYKVTSYQGAKYQSTDWADAFRNTPVSGRAFHGDVSSGGPQGTWWFYDSMRHSNSGSYWGTQIAYGWEDNGNELWQRNISGNNFSGWVRYLNSNNYSGYAVKINDWHGNLYHHTDGRIYATIYYDANNSGYYFDPDGTSNVYNISASNYIRASSYLQSGGNVYIDNNYGYGHVGVYTSTRYQGVFAMGDSYKLPADGTTTGSLYGIAWSHPNAGGVAGNLNTHGALIMENGSFLAALSGSIRCRDDMRAPLYYDSNDTGYYCDPASTNRLNYVNSNNHYIQPGYMLYSDHGSWQGEYNKIQWHSSHLYLQNAGGGYLLILRRGDGGERFYCDYNGNVTASGNITAYSDASLKTNVETIQSPIQLVKRLRGVTFDWIESGEHSYGLIAQEVEQVIPELVMENENGTADGDESVRIKSVDYSKLVSVLIEAVKEQQSEIDELKSLVKQLLAK